MRSGNQPVISSPLNVPVLDPNRSAFTPSRWSIDT
jgi:hypothetical protein